jgi:hypothetical protein
MRQGELRTVGATDATARLRLLITVSMIAVVLVAGIWSFMAAEGMFTDSI